MKEFSNWSRIAGIHTMSLNERRKRILQLPLKLSEEDFVSLDFGLSLTDAEKISENVIGIFSLPLSIAPNFIIDGMSAIVPLVTEEPSIVAGLSKMAKIISFNHGFKTLCDLSLMKGQIQVYGFRDIDAFLFGLDDFLPKLKELANETMPTLVKRGGGVLKIEKRVFKKSINSIPMVLIEPIIDVKDAMGANIINTLMEKISEIIEEKFQVEIGLKILSNLADQRLAKAYVEIPFDLLFCKNTNINGQKIAEKILLAHQMAQMDAYRACTHNKGILNGVDALAIASGNDFRAIEASCHAFASKNGRYEPLTNLWLSAKSLHAEITLPLAVGVVGGNGNIHQGVKTSLKLLGTFGESAQGLSRVMACVGLAQCLAALHAICSEGIQKGHMMLHKKKDNKA